jgi:[ribosomal protein S18]-alanine N-acetyltransferase
MIDIKIFTGKNCMNKQEIALTCDFLYVRLEQYGDKKEDIAKCISYAIKENDKPGGFVLHGYLDEILVGVVVVNSTGMSGYIPENILVYIAAHPGYRGKGIGTSLMRKAMEIAEGGIALHVEPDNPAKFLYEKLGFTNKYLEMRYTKSI